MEAPSRSVFAARSIMIGNLVHGCAISFAQGPIHVVRQGETQDVLDDGLGQSVPF